MENNNIDTAFEDVFAIEETNTEGENEQETAEPVDADEGEKAQEPAEPVEDDNARFAAARRKAEAQRDEAIKNLREEYDNKIRSLGLTNPYTGDIVQTFDDLGNYTAKLREEQAREAEERLEEAGLSKDDINGLIESHPDVIKARESEKRLAELEKANQEQRNYDIFQKELEKIKAYDSSVKDASDVFSDEVANLVNRGYDISDAYLIVHKDEIMSQKAGYAAQEARNNIASKAHLEKSAPHGTGGIEIPADVYDDFMLLNPNATKESIRKFYERDLKRTRKDK